METKPPENVVYKLTIALKGIGATDINEAVKDAKGDISEDELTELGEYGQRVLGLKRLFKDLKTARFKYGGPACDLAESLYRMGLLSEEPVQVNGSSVVPLVYKIAARS